MEKIKKFSKSAYAFIFCTAMNSIIDLFIWTFFTAYMLNISGYDLTFIAKFYILTYVCIGIGYFGLTPIVKKINQVHFVRLGAIIKGAFILLVVFLGESIQVHYVWLAVLYGLIEAIFWSGNNIFKNMVVESKRLKALNSITGVNTQIIGIVFPIVFGISIDAVSFTKIAILVLVVSIAQVISTLFLQTIDSLREKIKMREYIKECRNSSSKGLIRQVYALMFFRGLQYFMPTYITYLIVIVLKTNTSLGILTTVAAIASIFVLILFNVIKKADTNIWLYIAFTIVQCASLLLCNIYITVALIVVLQIVYTVSKTVFDALTEAVRGSVILDAGLQKYLPESMAVGEVFLNAGRVGGYLVLLVLGLVNTTLSNTIVTILFMSFIALFVMTICAIKVSIKKKAQNITENIVESAENTSEEQKL